MFLAIKKGKQRRQERREADEQDKLGAGTRGPCLRGSALVT